jgi:phosphocarrier protein HPr
MIEKQLTVANQSGLHARPAALFVQAAKGFDSKVRLKKGEKQADAKSILEVIGLVINKGTSIILSAEGADEDEAMEALVKLITDNFGEGA